MSVSNPSEGTIASGLSAMLREQMLLMAELHRRQRTNVLAAYRPYAKQREFHAAGAAFRERLFMAGNQLGKTLAGAAEAAMHLTGRYPDWWQGRRFDRPIVLLAGSESYELTRDGVQRLRCPQYDPCSVLLCRHVCVHGSCLWQILSLVYGTIVGFCMRPRR